MWLRNEASPAAKGGAAAQRSIEGTGLLLSGALELRAPLTQPVPTGRGAEVVFD